MAADRIVTWKALADFSKVRKEAAQTQASLAALQKQIDKNNVENNLQAVKDKKNAQQEKTDNASLLSGLAAVTKARTDAAKATKESTIADTASTIAAKAESAAQRDVADATKQTSLARTQSASSGAQASKAVLAHEAALRREALAANSVQANVANLNKSRESLAAASYRAADAEARLAEVVEQQGAHSSDARTASEALTKARAEESNAASRVESATLRLSNSYTRHDQALASLSRTAAAANRDMKLFDSTMKGAAEDDGGKLGRGLLSLGNVLDGLKGKLGGIGMIGTALKFAGMAAGIIELISAVSALASGLFALTSAIGPALGGLAAIGPLASAGIGGVGALGLAFSGVFKAVTAYGNQQAKVATQATQSANQQIMAAQAIAHAQRALADARYQVGITERNTAQNIASAAHTVADAKYSEQQAEISLSQARKDALANIVALRQAVIDAALAEKGATLGLADAQANLQRVMNDPNSTRLQREQAQLQVENAQNQMTTSQKASVQSQKDYRDAATKGVEGSKSVKDAKHSETQAHYQVGQAVQAYNNAVQDGAHANKQALQGVKDAQEALANAIRAASQAQLAGANSANAYNTAMNKLTPSQKLLVAQILSLRSAFSGLKELAAADILPGFTTLVKNLKRDLPGIRVFLDDSAKAVGNFLGNLGKMLGNSAWQKSFAIFGKANAVIIKNLGDAFLHLMDLFRAISEAAIPMTEKLTKGFDQWITRLDKVHSSAAGMSKMTDFFDRSYKVLHQLGQIFGNIIGGLLATGRAASSSGQSMLDSIQRITQRWETWTKSVKGQTEMKDYFDKVRVNVAAIAHLLGVLTKIFIGLGANSTLASFANGITLLVTKVQAFFAGFGGADAGKKVADIFKNVADAFGQLGAVGGTTMSATLNILDLLAKALNGIMKVPGAGDIILGLAAAFATFKGLQIATQITQMDKLFKVASQFTKGFGASTGTLSQRIAAGIGRVGISDKDVNEARGRGEDDPQNGLVRGTRTAARGARATGRATLAGARRAASGTRRAAANYVGAFGARSRNATEEDPVTRGVRAANGGRDDAIRIMNNAAGGGGGAPAPEEETSRPTRGARMRSAAGNLAGKGSLAAGGIAGAAALAAQIPALSKFSGLLNTIAIVAGVAAAGMQLFNLAMEADPIVLVITAIVAAVVAIGYLIVHFGLAQKALKVLGAAFSWLYNNAIKPAWDAIVKAFNYLWNSVISPTIGFITKAFQTLWNSVLSPIFNLWLSTWKTLFTVLMAVWNNVGAPIFNYMVKLVQWMWETVLVIIFDLIMITWKLLWLAVKASWAVGEAVFKAVAAAANWLWKNVLKPVWDAIKAAWAFLWAGIKTDWAVGKAVFNAVASAAKWVWENVLRPVWNAIKSAWNFLWNGIKTDWQIGKDVFNAVMSIVRLVWNSVLKPIFSAIGSGFGTLWDGIKTIWQAVGAPIFHAMETVWDGVKSAFSTAWDFISSGFRSFVSNFGSIWKTLEDVFMAPVKFVVNTVIDGWLLGNINKVLNFLNLTPIPLMPPIGGGGSSTPNLGGGGSTSGGGKFVSRADGGWIPGNGPGARVPGTGNRDSVPAMLMPGEFVIRKRAAETLGHDTLQQLNRADGANVPSTRQSVDGRPAYGIGGWISNTVGDVASGISDAAGAAWGAMKDVAGVAARMARKGAAGVLRGVLAPLRGTMHATLGHMGLPGRAASGAVDHTIESILKWISGNSGVKTGLAAKFPTGDLGTGDSSNISANQRSNALAIIATGKSMGLSSRDIEVAFMTAMTESNMRNLANPNVPESMSLPHDGTGTDHDSVGMFQQRNSWGSAAQRLSPAATSRLFFNRLVGLGPGRNSMGMGQEAQAVQVSAFPDAYNTWQNYSIDLYNRLTASSAKQATGSGPGGRKAFTAANGGYVPRLAFHSGGPVPGFVPGKSSSAALSAVQTQAGLGFPTGNSGWSAALSAQYRKRLSGVNKVSDVKNTSAFPFVENVLDPNSKTTASLMSWVNGHDPLSYTAMWEGQTTSVSSANPNSHHRNPLLPILSYLGSPGKWKGYGGDTEAAYWKRVTAQDKAADAAYNKDKKNKKKRHNKYDLASEKKRHPSAEADFKKKSDSWGKEVGILSKASSTETSRITALRKQLGLTGNGTNHGLFASDMMLPLDHAAAHAVGVEHPADWPHPWSGAVNSVEGALADSDRSNALNAEWFADLQTIATWGMPDLLQYLMDKGITDGLQIARDSVKNKTQAQQLNDSIKAGKAGFGGLTGSDQETALKIVAKLAGGSEAHPFGLRDVSSMLQTPDYAVINLVDKMGDMLKKVDPKKMTKFNQDVNLFRQGLFYAATGGTVPGTGSGDTVPAMLTPGEFVVRKKAVEALGMGTLHQINHADQAGTQFFASGGSVLAPNVSATPSLAPGALNVNTPKVTPSGPTGNTYVTEINTEINNPTGENSVYSMNKMLRRKSATGQFDRTVKETG